MAILGGYAVLAVLGVALALHTRGTRAGPTAYVATVMSRRVGRWLVLLGWMWTGWHFFVR